MGEREAKVFLYPKVSYYWPNIDYYSYKMFYVCLIETTKQKPTVHTQKIKEKKLKYTLTENKSQRRKGKMTKKSDKTNNKMSMVRPYLSVIILTINGLNSPNEKHRVAECIKEKQKETRSNYVLPIRDPL